MMSRQLKLFTIAVCVAILLLILYRSSHIDYNRLPIGQGLKSSTGGATSTGVGGTGTEEQLHTPPEQNQQSEFSSNVDQQTEDYIPSLPEHVNDLASTTQSSHHDELSADTTAQESKPTHSATGSSEEDVDWSRFAYTQYVTNGDYLCNSVMIFEALHRMGSKPDRVMMYPEWMYSNLDDDSQPKSINERLIIKARDKYEVKLVPITIEHRDGQDGKTFSYMDSIEMRHRLIRVSDTWADSYTKLLAFNQTQYDRVLSLDSDATVLQPMDELFLLPPCPVAMPRAYWLLDDEPPKKILSSQLILLQPSTAEFDRVHNRIHTAAENQYDMEIVNDLYLDSALVLPHRPYDMLTAEFRRRDHAGYLGSDTEKWDPVAAYNEAKFVHFSDWPVPKPWLSMEDEVRDEKQPECEERDGELYCTERTIWNNLYDDFAKQREVRHKYFQEQSNSANHVCYRKYVTFRSLLMNSGEKGVAIP